MGNQSFSVPTYTSWKEASIFINYLCPILIKNKLLACHFLRISTFKPSLNNYEPNDIFFK